MFPLKELLTFCIRNTAHEIHLHVVRMYWPWIHSRPCRDVGSNDVLNGFSGLDEIRETLILALEDDSATGCWLRRHVDRFRRADFYTRVLDGHPNNGQTELPGLKERTPDSFRVHYSRSTGPNGYTAVAGFGICKVTSLVDGERDAKCQTKSR